jgi:hypothetical protein
VGIILGDGTNRIAFYTGGKDRIPFQAGGWQCHVVDYNNPPPLINTIAGSLAALNWSAITQFGYRFKTLAKSLGGAENCFVDVARYGTGITLAGGTAASPATFFSASQADLSTATGRAWGIIRELQPGIYGAQGRIDFGDPGTGSSYFQGQDDLLVWEDWFQSDYLYSSTCFGNSGGTNVIEFGQPIGTGDGTLGANGCTFQSSGPKVWINWTGSANLTGTSYVNVYGSKFFKIYSDFGSGSKDISFNRSGSDFIGNVVDQCTQVNFGDTKIRNCSFSGTNATSGSIVWSGSFDLAYCAFNNNTIIGTNPPNVNAGIYVPNYTGLTEVTFDNLSFSGNDYDILSAYTGTLTVQSTDSNPSSYTASYDPTPGDVNIINNVFLTINVEDVNGIAISSASVWIATDEPESTRTVLMNEYTTPAGVAIENYNYLTDQDVIIRVRKSSPGDTRYNNVSTVGLIDDGGLTTTIVMSVDGNIEA